MVVLEKPTEPLLAVNHAGCEFWGSMWLADMFGLGLGAGKYLALSRLSVPNEAMKER
jgi:hypothetical protein